MRFDFLLPGRRLSPAGLLAWTLGATFLIFVVLQLWRPCYFLTDDNLSSLLPVFTEMGRHLHAGQAPFTTNYLFGGHYDLSRDLGYSFWHPFYLLPALLADTPARFWMLDAVALLFLLLGAAGFVLLAGRLRDEYAPDLPDGYLIFYTLSYTFSTYALMTGASWINFLSNQAALPWLVIGVLSRSVLGGTSLVALFAIDEWIGAYPALTLSTAICLTIFAAGMAVCRGSTRPLFNWIAGNLAALVVMAPFILHILDGFGHANRVHGLSLAERSEYFIPWLQFPYSFFLGNWTEPLTRWAGDPNLSTLKFPYATTLLACAAAWCLVPALVSRVRWRGVEFLCLGLAAGLAVMIMRPPIVTSVMFHLPLFKSMRWPFREGLQLLFFVHLLILLRPLGGLERWRPRVALFSLLAFAAPLPWVRPPTFNPLALDRALLFSGKADLFWARVKMQLQPGDQIATVINWEYWRKNSTHIPYSLMGTANFPAFFQVHCISGYSTTSPLDQLPIPIQPGYWFGAYQTNQLDEILARQPGLKLIRVESTNPLTITLSTGNGPPVDLSPDIPK